MYQVTFNTLNKTYIPTFTSENISGMNAAPKRIKIGMIQVFSISTNPVKPNFVGDITFHLFGKSHKYTYTENSALNAGSFSNNTSNTGRWVIDISDDVKDSIINISDMNLSIDMNFQSVDSETPFFTGHKSTSFAQYIYFTLYFDVYN